MSVVIDGQVIEDCLFVDPNATVTVHAPWWPAGQDVVIKRDMDFATRRATENAIVRTHQNGRKTDVATEVAEGKLVSLQRMIVSWTLKDRQGNPMPLNEQTINLLRGRNAQYIADVISQNNPDPDPDDEDETKTFLATAGSISPASAPRHLKSLTGS